MSVQQASVSFRKKIAFQVIAICIVLPLCALAIRPIWDGLNWGQVTLAWHGITPMQWVMAALATCASFAALGRYDVIVHRVIGTKVDTLSAQASGAAAVALSQTLGFGLIIGTLARWRALPTLSLAQSGAVTALVSFSFLGAWLGMFALAGLSFPDVLPLPRYVYVASLLTALCLVLYTLIKRHVTLAQLRVRMPSLHAISSLVVFTAIDTGCAAFALWILLPAGTEFGFLQFFPIFLACLGAALISSTPCGLGPFEVTLFWALQGQDMNGILAALIAFRVVYFALPACLAILFLARWNGLDPTPDTQRLACLRVNRPHVETPAALQCGAWLTDQTHRPIAALAHTTQASVAVFEPAAPPTTVLPRLERAARNQAKVPVLYKCSARSAAVARRMGWTGLRIARDGILDLSGLDLARPERKTLRRKLRQAEKADLTIRPLILSDEQIAFAAKIDSDWCKRNNGARGFSMGRFSRSYIEGQQLFAAWHNQQMVAFISCHAGPREWALDLMRSRADLPPGTMHALVWAAIEHAKSQGAEQFSLASSPFPQGPFLRWVERLNPRAQISNSGLEQFKRSFAPRWVPLYAAAPNLPALCLGLWDIWQEVQDPPPLPPDATP